ncbi:MAG: hypothetical protein PHX51_08610 [Clostridia bacterium]|nr:hypothetical protein [Clostridia bacterium]
MSKTTTVATKKSNQRQTTAPSKVASFNKIKPVFFNVVKERELLAKIIGELEVCGVSFSSYVKYLLLDSELITNNKDSNFYKDMQAKKDYKNHTKRI